MWNSTADAEGVISQQNICLCCKSKEVNLSDLTVDLQSQKNCPESEYIYYLTIDEE